MAHENDRMFPAGVLYLRKELVKVKDYPDIGCDRELYVAKDQDSEILGIFDNHDIAFMVARQSDMYLFWVN